MGICERGNRSVMAVKDIIKDKKALDYFIKNEGNISILKSARKFHICEKRLSAFIKENNYEHYLLKSRNIYKVNDNYFVKINNSQKAYWLGFILADGCIKKNNTFQLALKKDDKVHLEKFLKCIKGDFKIIYEKRSFDSKLNCVLRIHRIKFCQNLIRLGVDKNKSTKEKVPLIKEKYYSHFIRGIFDGDGWLCIGKNKEFGICSSFDICNFIAITLTKEIVGLKFPLITLNNKKKKNSLFRIRFHSKKDIILILRYIYKDSTVSLDRKRNLFKKFLEEENN